MLNKHLTRESLFFKRENALNLYYYLSLIFIDFQNCWSILYFKVGYVLYDGKWLPLLMDLDNDTHKATK